MSFADMFFNDEDYDDPDGLFHDIYGVDYGVEEEQDFYDGDYGGEELGHESEEERDDMRQDPSEYELELAARGLPPQWAFLKPWFVAISHMLLLEDTQLKDVDGMMIGRDPQDFWLGIKIVGGLEETITTLGERARLLREALYLTSLAALVDYDMWLSEMLHSQCIKPPMTMNVEFDTIPRQFIVHVSPDAYDNPSATITSYSRSKVFQELFDSSLSEYTSTDFATSYKAICDLGREQGISMDELQRYSLPLKFDVFGGASHELALSMLNTVTDVIEVTNAASTQQTIATGRSMFHVHDVRLDLASISIDAAGFSTVERLLATGVHFEVFAIPRLSISTVLEEETEIRFAWTSFVQKLLDPNTTPRIEWLQLNGDNLTEPYLAPLFTSLAHATSISGLNIKMQPQAASKYEHLWCWLAYALFSRQSSTSIHKLMISGIDVSDGGFVRAVAEFVAVVDPVHHLWRRSALGADDVDGAVHPATWITLSKGTTVAIQGFTEGAVASARLQVDCQACVVQDDPASDFLKALVSGVGFCHVARAHLSSKRRKLDSRPQNTRLSTLDTLCLITEQPQKPPEWFPSPRRTQEWTEFLEKRAVFARHKFTLLLHSIGRSLTTLRLKSEFLDDATVAQLLSQCPLLKRLKLEGGALTSLEPICAAYQHQPPCRVESLELGGKLVPIPEFEGFIRVLGTDDKLMGRLRRLRFGDGGMCDGFTAATGDTVYDMMTLNRQLTHLQIVTPWHTNADFGRIDFHRERLPEQLPPLRSRLAFLSALQQKAPALSTDVLIKLIFQFASSPAVSRVMTVDRVFQ